MQLSPVSTIISSDVSKIYPLGLLVPSITKAKFIFQEWLLQIKWDDEITTQLQIHWTTFRSALHKLEYIKIKGWILNNNNQPELHGFNNNSSSRLAYEAGIYARCSENANKMQFHINTSSTTPAPLNKLEITQQKLFRLMNEITHSLSYLMIINSVLWTNSTFMLSSPRRHKSFITNKSSGIIQSFSTNNCHNIESIEIPANTTSQGKPTGDLISNKLWWNYPDFHHTSQPSQEDNSTVVFLHNNNQLCFSTNSATYAAIDQMFIEITTIIQPINKSSNIQSIDINNLTTTTTT